VTLRIEGAVLYLGRLQRDAIRHMERVRLANFRSLLPSLLRAKIRSKMVGRLLVVQTKDPSQLKLPFMQAG